MNPLVEKMLIAQREGIDVRTLEDLFEHEAKCQSSHNKQVPVCSGVVVARKTTECDHKDFLICENSYRWNMESLSNPYAICIACKLDTAECWTIRPI